MFRPTAIAGWRRSSVLQAIDYLLTDGRKVSAGLIRSGQPIVVLVQENPLVQRPTIVRDALTSRVQSHAEKARHSSPSCVFRRAIRSSCG